jgi:ketosteroid isomerase-like protein
MKRFSFGKRALVAAGAIAILFAASSAFAADKSDAAAKALTKLDDDWSKAAATKDADRVASFYADDAIAYPPNAPVSTGRAAAKTVWASFFADKSFSISWKTTHAGASGDLGFTTGTYDLSFNGADGKLVSDKGKYVCIWKKQKDGSWKAIHDMWNSDSK